MQQKHQAGCVVRGLKLHSSYPSPVAGRSSRPRVELKLALSKPGVIRWMKLLRLLHGLGAREVCCSRERRFVDGPATKSREAKHRNCQEHDPTHREESYGIVATEVIDSADQGGPKKHTDCNPQLRRGPTMMTKRLRKRTVRCRMILVAFVGVSGLRKVFGPKPSKGQPGSGMLTRP